MGEWSKIPNELLEMVLDRLPLIPDHIRFGAVCTSWYQIRMENPHWLDFQGKLPLMMLPDEEGTDKELLTATHESSNIHLLNPFTSNQIQLPSLDKFPDNQNQYDPEVERDYRYMVEALLSANPISTPDYVVVTIVILVESCGRLLKVLREYEWNDAYPAYVSDDEDGNEPNPLPEWYFRTVGFEAFELDQDTGNWIEIDSLGDQILFLGFNSSFSLSQLMTFSSARQTASTSQTATKMYRIGIMITRVFDLEDKSLKRIDTSIWIWKPLWVHPYFSN
ncbi:uncharacterized protein LOC143882481 [Tasmannia lanceolata]|uniref:uncharacterized protein LOC143882481 n=1 Tax=Tasmannia lanceolata TaxID=3420 RepID=UPI004063EF0B